ncbi:lytic tail protein [Paracoccus phage ParKuw1]|uniref:Lytic tail protein n=1 Tax=Paracoccus phage ParKuw1 TaxID=3032415 RepID=A0AAF0JIT7_9CAUD|nr:lytic tail protein [Paracoccus phage ParKuw1]
MAQGLERRAQPVDNLRGQEAVNPVTRSVPSAGSVPTPRVPEATFGQQIASQVSQFAGERLQQIQAARQERSMMDGQIAAMQGASFESVEMQGDKWALEGWRVVSAQTMASSLLRAQEAEISAGAYEQDPDTYRETLVGRIEGMTADIPDERTRMLARDNLMQQMPGLVDAHMRQNIGFREQQNFDALAASVDTLSRDNTATGALVAFAMGESEATAGLSVERRRAAVVQGVVNSFTNNNPAAFAHLEAAGFFTTDNLTASQLQTIRTAQRQYEARFREVFNAEHHQEVTRINEEAANGQLDPLVAAEQLAAANARHGLRTGAAEGGQIYDRARNGVEFDEGTRGLNIQAAGVNGDYDLQARLLQDAVIHQESRGNPNAVSPVGATGMMQIMPDTAADPGFGVRNIFQVAMDVTGMSMSEARAAGADALMRDPDINVAMGTEYLATMLERYGGDVERALAAYNWGPGRADNWNGDRSTLPAETQGYLRNILGAINDDRPDPEAARIAAERNLTQARERAGLRVLEQSGPQMAYNDELFTRGQIGVEEWRAGREEIYQQWGMELDAQRINQEQAMMRSVAGQEIQRMTMAGNAQQAIELQAGLAAAEVQLQGRREAFQEGRSDMTLDEINAEYMTSVLGAYEASGAELDAGDLGTRARNTVLESAEVVRTALQGQEEQAIIGNAETAGTVGTLPAHLQERALEQFDRQLQGQVQNFRAENPDVPEAIVGAMERQARVEYVTRNGIVDTEVQQMINLAASGQAWIGPDGEPNPSVVVGLHTFTSMMAENPALAYQYVTDPTARGRMLAAAHIVETQFPDRDVFTDVDLTNRDDPVANAFHTAVHQVGLSLNNPPSAEETEARVGAAMDALEGGNLTNSFMGGLFRDDVADAIAPRGTLANLFSGTHEFIDAEAARRMDREAINSQYQMHVERFLTEIVPHMPGTDRDGAVQMAMDYVRTRGAMMGSGYVMPPPGEPGIRAQMFPGQQVENMAAVNTAIGLWMADPAIQEANPILADVPNSVFWRGTPEYTVTRLNGQYVATIPGHGSIVLPLREIGDHYVSNR